MLISLSRALHPETDYIKNYINIYYEANVNQLYICFTFTESQKTHLTSIIPSLNLRKFVKIRSLLFEMR